MRQISNILSLKSSERKHLIFGFSLVFLVFLSYAILRPLRDALALTGHHNELKWLFLATFITICLFSFLAITLSSYIKKRHYTTSLFAFFISNLIGFYIAINFIDRESDMFLWLCRVFFVWVSVFNVFIISIAWSVLADVFGVDSSRRLFGILAAGASLGSICGSFLVGLLVTFLGIGNFLVLSTLCLLLAFGCKYQLIKNNENFSLPIGSKNPLEAIFLIAKSRYLMLLVCFIILLTSISTFLYMEQARVIKAQFFSIETRTQIFARIELIVQLSSLFIQLFLTAKIAKLFGIKALLSVLGCVVGIGFLLLVCTHPSFMPFVIVMCIRRIGEYAFIKPGREMLFVPLSVSEKYKVKNFLDSVVYRGGDALSAQIEGFLSSISIHIALLCGGWLSIVWSYVGYRLGKLYQSKNVS